MTSYVAVLGPDTTWKEDSARFIGDIKDEHDTTILLVEVADSGIHWMEPRDLHIVRMSPTLNSATGQGIRSYHTRGAFVATVDGRTRFLPNSTTADELRAMLQINDGK